MVGSLVWGELRVTEETTASRDSPVKDLGNRSEPCLGRVRRRDNGADVARDRGRSRFTRGKLGRERGGAAHRVVLPGNRAAGELRQRMVRQPGDPREPLLDPPVAARGP